MLSEVWQIEAKCRKVMYPFRQVACRQTLVATCKELLPSFTVFFVKSSYLFKKKIFNFLWFVAHCSIEYFRANHFEVNVF
jgi:hypothetical protein